MRETVSTAGKQIDSLQYMRAVAAILVVIGHVQGAALDFFGTQKLFPFKTGFGVDLFFVISGFVMAYTTKDYGSKRSALLFVDRRLSRIVPLYWLATLSFVVLLTMGGSTINILHVILSLLFIPIDSLGTGHPLIFPIYNLGWTLNYEMLFYVIFATCILFKRRQANVICVLAIMTLVCVGLAVDLSNHPTLRFWTQAIILEFVFGLVLGHAFRAGYRMSDPARLLLAGLAIGFVVWDPLAPYMEPLGGTTPNNLVRVIAWGIPMAMLLLSVVFSQSTKGVGLPYLHVLGDASYSLYLLHPFAVIVLSKALLRSGLPLSVSGPLFLMSAIAVSIGLAILSFRFIEKPSGRWLKGILVKRSSELTS